MQIECRKNATWDACDRYTLKIQVGDSIREFCDEVYKFVQDHSFDEIYVEYNFKRIRIHGMDTAEDIMHKLYKNDRKNAEGYDDPTAYEGIKRAERSKDEERETIAKLIGCIRRVCELSGYTLENRVSLKNIKTGKVWE